MNKAIVMILAMTFLNLSCQEKQAKETADFRVIDLGFRHSMSEESLTVNIQKYQDDNIVVYYKYVPLIPTDSTENQFKSYRISKEKFDSLVKMIKEINRSNIEVESGKGMMDGISTSISYYKENENTILNIYSIMSPDVSTKERKIEDYLTAYYEIVRLANIDPDRLFE